MPWSKIHQKESNLPNARSAMGVNPSQILLTGTVTTTADEADEVKTLMEFAGMDRLILVTSANHMPRAKTLFDRAGINSIPYPTDFKSTGVTSTG